MTFDLGQAGGGAACSPSKSLRSSAQDTARPISTAQNGAPIERIGTFATVTRKQTVAPSVKPALERPREGTLEHAQQRKSGERRDERLGGRQHEPHDHRREDPEQQRKERHQHARRITQNESCGGGDSL